jgi:hypothetical protein
LLEEDRMNRWMLAGMTALVVIFAFPAALEAG